MSSRLQPLEERFLQRKDEIAVSDGEKPCWARLTERSSSIWRTLAHAGDCMSVCSAERLPQERKEAAGMLGQVLTAQAVGSKPARPGLIVDPRFEHAGLVLREDGISQRLEVAFVRHRLRLDSFWVRLYRPALPVTMRGLSGEVRRICGRQVSGRRPHGCAQRFPREVRLGHDRDRMFEEPAPIGGIEGRRGHDDDRDRAASPRSLQRTQRFAPVHARQDQIEQDDVGLLGRNPLQAFLG